MILFSQTNYMHKCETEISDDVFFLKTFFINFLFINKKRILMAKIIYIYSQQPNNDH
jgi:hypothetical protein